jgi:hypothetical protein
MMKFGIDCAIEIKVASSIFQSHQKIESPSESYEE